jgi:hypothetical protein
VAFDLSAGETSSQPATVIVASRSESAGNDEPLAHPHIWPAPQQRGQAGAERWYIESVVARGFLLSGALAAAFATCCLEQAP